jgi:transcriptional regulator with GAF, ATPase, and Fis domain
MENHTALKSNHVDTEDISTTNHSYQLKDFAASRIQAVKSLATILMKELELLETLTKANEVIKNEEISLTDAVAHFESELIRTALIQTKGHQRNAARLLGTKVTTLNMKMKRYGIDCREFTFFDSEYNN